MDVIVLSIPKSSQGTEYTQTACSSHLVVAKQCCPPHHSLTSFKCIEDPWVLLDEGKDNFKLIFAIWVLLSENSNMIGKGTKQCMDLIWLCSIPFFPPKTHGP